jgi:hypothetical protein
MAELADPIQYACENLLDSVLSILLICHDLSGYL